MSEPKTLRKSEWGDVSTALAKLFDRSDLFRSCLSCLHFNEGLEQCKAFNARPPARIIANGCDRYGDIMEIPF